MVDSLPIAGTEPKQNQTGVRRRLALQANLFLERRTKALTRVWGLTLRARSSLKR